MNRMQIPTTPEEFLETTKTEKIVFMEHAHKWVRQLLAENERLTKEMSMALLHLDASVCECGEPLKETDAADALRQALGNPAITVYE